MLFDLASHWERLWGLVWGWFFFKCCEADGLLEASLTFYAVFFEILCTQIHGKCRALCFQFPLTTPLFSAKCMESNSKA